MTTAREQALDRGKLTKALEVAAKYATDSGEHETASSFRAVLNLINRGEYDVPSPPSGKEGDFIDFVCDGPPGPEGGRFVEVENEKGESINVGEWIQKDGYWVLRVFITPEKPPQVEYEALLKEALLLLKQASDDKYGFEATCCGVIKYCKWHEAYFKFEKEIKNGPLSH